MIRPKVTHLIVERTRQLIASAREVIPQARGALSKPAVVGYIVLTSHRAQITLGLLLLFLIFLAPLVVDFVTGTVFPPETSKKVFGLIKTQQANPLADVSYVAIMILLWVGSTVSTLFDLPPINRTG